MNYAENFLILNTKIFQFPVFSQRSQVLNTKSSLLNFYTNWIYPKFHVTFCDFYVENS